MIDKIESEYSRYLHFYEKIKKLMSRYISEYGSFDDMPDNVKEKFYYLFETLEKSNRDLLEQLSEYEDNLN